MGFYPQLCSQFLWINLWKTSVNTPEIQYLCGLSSDWLKLHHLSKSLFFRHLKTCVRFPTGLRLLNLRSEHDQKNCA